MSAQQQRTYYEILNVNQNATFEELKIKYKQMILQCHPDKLLQQQQHQQHSIDDIKKLENDLNNSAREDFVVIAEAWNCLKDPLKRKKYDAELLLNKFHTHNNVYAHITLKEMTKCLDDDDDNCGDDDDNGHEDDVEQRPKESDNKNTEAIKFQCYYYTYDCRCGGQYIVDESAVEYCCHRSKSSAVCSTTSQQYGDAATAHTIPNNKNKSPNNTDSNHAEKNGGGGGVDVLSSSEGVSVNQNCSGGQHEEDKDTDDNELIVECSECSLVIILLNG